MTSTAETSPHTLQMFTVKQYVLFCRVQHMPRQILHRLSFLTGCLQITAATEMKSLHDTSLSLPEGHPDNCVGVRNGRKVVAIMHCRVGKVCLYSPRASHGPLTLAAEAFHLSQQPLGMTCHIFFTSWIQERLPSSSHTATAIMADPSACEQHFSKQ